MDWYKTVTDFYNSGLYDKNDVALFVRKGKITPGQYSTITGEDYPG